MMTEHRDITAILADWNRGEKGAVEEMIPLIYDQLRIIARARLKMGRAQFSLRTNGLVNEA